jgi:hypothetical protein
VLRGRVGILALGLVVALLSSCGGSGDKKATAAAVTAKSRAVDAARAKRVVLRLADLPRGWRVDRTAKPPGGCRGYLTGLTKTADVKSQFEKGSTLNVDSRMVVFASESETEKAFSGLAASSMRQCYKRDLKRLMGTLDEVRSGQAQVGDITVRSLAGKPYGEQSGTLRAVVHLSVGSVGIDLHSDSVFVRQDRGLLLANFAKSSDDFDATLQARLLGAMSARLAPR